MAENKVECSSGVKTAQNSKKEGGIERKKTGRCEAERRCAWEILL